MSDEGFPFILPPDHEDAEDVGINFQTEDIDFVLPDPQIISQWIETIIAQEDRKLHSLTFIFCSDTYLHQVNMEYLNHDTLTDIITFPYADPPEIRGDIFISIDRVRENAQDRSISFREELHRVIIHGVLHLCGYSDKKPADKKRMTSKEDEALRLFPHP